MKITDWAGQDRHHRRKGTLSSWIIVGGTASADELAEWKRQCRRDGLRVKTGTRSVRLDGVEISVTVGVARARFNEVHQPPKADQ